MNAITILQKPEETKLAAEVNQSAAIGSIRLARAKAHSQALGGGPQPPIAVTFSFSSKPVASPANILRFEIAFRMSGVEDRQEAKNAKAGRKSNGKKAVPVVQVECVFEVDYTLREGFSITPRHVKAFKDGNAIFNVWPYFREYLQSTLQRMGLPPLTAPFLRLGPRPKPSHT